MTIWDLKAREQEDDQGDLGPSHTIWVTVSTAPAPDPGDPGGSSAAADGEDYRNEQSTNAWKPEMNREEATFNGQQTEHLKGDGAKKKSRKGRQKRS